MPQSRSKAWKKIQNDYESDEDEMDFGPTNTEMEVEDIRAGIEEIRKSLAKLKSKRDEMTSPRVAIKEPEPEGFIQVTESKRARRKARRQRLLDVLSKIDSEKVQKDEPLRKTLSKVKPDELDEMFCVTPSDKPEREKVNKVASLIRKLEAAGR